MLHPPQRFLHICEGPGGCGFGACCAGAGPAAELRPVLEELTAGGVFVRELDTNGVAFHSPALAPALPGLRTCESSPDA